MSVGLRHSHELIVGELNQDVRHFSSKNPLTTVRLTGNIRRQNPSRMPHMPAQTPWASIGVEQPLLRPVNPAPKQRPTRRLGNALCSVPDLALASMPPAHVVRDLP
jgi:hypothetical protein